MDDVAIRFTGVSKAFRRGERHDSLRDLIPALVRRLVGQTKTRAATDREFLALDNIDLVVRHGETVGVIGHNGAGKSTMLKHLAGIMHPSSGRVEVNGRLSALIEVGAGFHPDLTGRENVYLSGVILGMTRAEVARKFDAIIDFAGLAQFVDTPVKRYSSGMFARLGFAVAAHLEPDILVIDEVLSVGDFIFQQKSLQKMREIARGGATVIFVSHNLKAVSDLCRRSVLLDAGAIVADGPTSHVIQTYLGRERSKISSHRNTDVEIVDVTLTRQGVPEVRFSSGDEANVTIRFVCRKPAQRVAVVIQVLDEGLENVFYTSSFTLGVEPLNMTQGQICTMVFDLRLHLATGTFHLGIFLHRPDTDRDYDRVVPAGTFFVAADPDVRGAANLYPKVRSTVLSDSHVEARATGAVAPMAKSSID